MKLDEEIIDDDIFVGESEPYYHIKADILDISLSTGNATGKTRLLALRNLRNDFLSDANVFFDRVDALNIEIKKEELKEVLK